MTTIELTNIGPIQKLSIPVPQEGGVCVLKGRNGRGKTKTLEAVESAMTGRGKIEVRDGELRGEVEAFGVSIKVGRSTRRSGELEVTSLDGRLSVAELVDPGIKSPEAADAKRIKALVQLAGVKPAAELFHDLVGGREAFDARISGTAAASDDLVLMAERIKRDLEAAARTEENQAEHAEGRARGASEAASGVDIAVEHDPVRLQAELETAIREESRLRSEKEAADAARKRIDNAKDSLEDAEAAYKGRTIAEARESELACSGRVEDARKSVADAEAALAKAKAELRAESDRLTAATRERELAEQHEAMIAKWREQLAGSVPTSPDTASLLAASERVQKARQAVEQGAIIRKAIQHKADAERHATEASTHRKAAEQLREAARGTDDVLSGVVAKTGSPLRVEAGRLVLTTSRGTTHFCELSHGERWKIALDIAIDTVGERGVLTIPQEAWESLDPTNRSAVAEHVAGRGVVILTAEASDDDEIVAEVYP